MRQVQWTITDESKYGLGLIVSDVNGRTYYGHSGGYPGHITISKVALDRKLSISVLMNANDGPAEKLCNAILTLIDLALNAKHEAKTKRRKAKTLARFEGRFATLWGVTDVVNLGGRLYVLNPTLESPAAEAAEMKLISDTELKTVGDKGFGGYGEVMRYTFDENDDVLQIRGSSGAKLVPIDSFSLPDKVVRPVRA